MKKYKDNYLLRILVFFIIMTIFTVSYRNIHYRKITVVNSEQVSLVTPLNDNQGYHPKVVAFEKQWNGYKYWMAFTPYPNGNELEENPVINASNDMIEWVEPEGLTNPLDIPVDVSKEKYNSDTHLLYNPDKEQLEVFWRYVNDTDNEVTIYMMTSKDGINWTKKEEFLKSDDRKSKDYVSPAIVYDNGTYKVWYVDKKKVNYLEKKDDKVSKSKVISIPYTDNHKTWHLDVIYNKDKDQYEMITCAYENINIRSNMNLYYTYSKDNKKWSKPVIVMRPSTDLTNWDSQGLYRSALLYENGKYYLFYSGHDEDMNVGVGLMQGENIKKLKPITK